MLHVTSDQSTGITVKAGVLRRSLAAVIAATGEDVMMLDKIAIEAGGGVLVMSATNRYLAAHARCEATGSLAEFGLKLTTAKLLMVHLRGLKPMEAITITQADRIVVDLPTAGLRLPTADMTTWPKLAKLWEPLTPELELADATAWNLGIPVLTRLSRILAAAGRNAQSATRWYRAQALKPFVVEVEDWLSLVLMPMRRTDPLPATRVPIGLPPVPTAKVARVRKALPIKAAAPVPAKAPRRRAS